MRNEKAVVRDFYDSFGWSTDSSGTYNDTAAFVDLRPVLSSYYHDTQMRVGRFLKRTGKYFLDAGSGPLSQPEYLLYSANYRRRVCVDISARALAEARGKLNDHGLYVRGDLASLPFREGSFDAVLCSHVLYHLPEDEQAGAVQELYRTLESGGTGVVIYIWPTSLHSRRSGTASTVERSGTATPPLYFHPHGYRWMRNILPGHWKTDIRVWRSVGIAFTRSLIPDNIVGTVLLRIIYWLEEVFPHTLARLGRYPMLLIKKTSG
jgi:ubiquinone/menaquinone biosynthesis C-methylase UbiE